MEKINEEKDIMEFYNANDVAARLKDLPHVQKWIEHQGNRELVNYIDKRFEGYISSYPHVNVDDLTWLRGCMYLSDGKWRKLVFYRLPNKDNPAGAIRLTCSGTNQDEYELPIGHVKDYELCISNFMPFEMTHLWGGGVKESVKNSGHFK